jgi:hypothetical protein
MPRPTIKSLTEALETSRSLREEDRKEILRLREQAAASAAEAKRARAEHDDLKARLLTLTRENEQMRGYIARVQEDDIVRESLVEEQQGEGNKRLVPKRMHRSFDRSLAMGDASCVGDMAIEKGYGFESRSREVPRNWTTYGPRNA